MRNVKHGTGAGSLTENTALWLVWLNQYRLKYHPFMAKDLSDLIIYFDMVFNDLIQFTNNLQKQSNKIIIRQWVFFIKLTVEKTKILISLYISIIQTD